MRSGPTVMTNRRVLGGDQDFKTNQLQVFSFFHMLSFIMIFLFSRRTVYVA